MSYLHLAVCFLLVAVVGGVILPLVARRGPLPSAVLLTTLVLLALTAVFDTVMIANGLFHYAQDPLLGVHIGLAPIEDFAYPLAGALLLPALWTELCARRRAHSELTAADEDRQ